ncbi:hypothetical protein [Clostridium botulinum]|uniref:hypothetical protein n=1 Tax=Clostridium botulinum TaxID=1491 RepID=UPI001C9B4782|nr:hypothetical protein [Clostridium botulinum]MBY6900214.1 hypothetical protein [Clostridium botulinum]MBY6914327.1 hypothetical protein [Clostridium botulinum]
MKYYEMEVTIKGKVLVPVDEYENKDTAIECTEMSEVEDVAYQIKENNDEPCFIFVNKDTVKEVEY